MPTDRASLHIGDHVRVRLAVGWESGRIVSQQGEVFTVQGYHLAGPFNLDPESEFVRLPAVLPGGVLTVVEANGKEIVTNNGVRFRLFPPTTHTEATPKHANPAVGNRLRVAGPIPGQVLDIDAMIVIEIEEGCGCQNIGLRVVSVGADDAA